MYKLDSNSKEPLHIQLYKELKQDIQNNLKVGDKLPSIRKIATLYNINLSSTEYHSHNKMRFFIGDDKFLQN
jgi:GntR family transcriptional regulator/MocR family aminotransferase